MFGRIGLWWCAVLGAIVASGRGWPLSQPVQLVTRTGTLHGTLEFPAGRAPWPVALIIAGSGPIDRNGNDLLNGVNTDCYRQLAKYLANRGIASVRYDKRGAGSDFILGLPESKLRFETFVSDSVGWGERLRNDPRFSTFTIIGHSEGSLIGMLAAGRLDADGFVSIAGAGERASQVLLAQLKEKLPANRYRTSQATIDQLAAGHMVKLVPQSLNTLFRPSVQPYLISWFRYDPRREIASLRMPVLIVQGARDGQVSVADGHALYRADPAARLVIVPRMDHVMKDDDASVQLSARAYQDPSLPIDVTLARSITGFILHLPSARAPHHDQ